MAKISGVLPYLHVILSWVLYDSFLHLWRFDGTVCDAVVGSCSGFKLAVVRGRVPAHMRRAPESSTDLIFVICSHLLHKCCFGAITFACLNVPQDFLSWILSWKKCFKVFSGSFSSSESQPVRIGCCFFYSHYSNERSGDFLTNTIQHIRKRDVYHSFSNYISPA